MQVTKQLIDEFESELVDLMRLFEGLKYNFSTESYLDAWGFCPDDAVTLNICLEVWLKQREKMDGLIKDFKRFVEIADQYDFGGVLTGEIEHINRLLQASQPQESNDE